eukprot:s9500_g2.t1
MVVEEVSSGEGDVEMEVPSGSSAARPPEVPKLLSGTGTEGITDAEMAELRIIMEEVWSPPFEAPSAVWSCHGPLQHNQTGYFDFWLSQGHLQSDSHMRQMERWMRADKPALVIPHDRFMDHESIEMLARHPLWSSNMVLFAKEHVLQMEFFKAQEGVWTGEIPAEFGSGRPEEEAAGSVVRPAPPTSTEEPLEKKPRVADPPPPKPEEKKKEKKKKPRATEPPPPKATEPPPPKSEEKREKQRRTKPWPDTHGVALRSSSQMERMGGVAPPLGPGISAQAVFEVSESEDDSWGDWRGVRASLQVAPSTPPKYPQRPSTPPTPPRAGPMWQWGQRTFLYLRRQWGQRLFLCLQPSYVQLDPHLLQHWTSGDLLFPFKQVLPYTAPAGPGYTSRAGRVGSCQGRGPGSAGQGDDVVFASAATPGGSSGFSSSGADSRASGIIDDGHVPYWANCEACNRSRRLTPARMRGDRPEKEYQVDQFMYRSRCFIVLVHVLAYAVAVTFRPEGMSGREASTYLEPWLAHFGLSRSGDTKPSFYSDPEPLTISIAQAREASTYLEPWLAHFGLSRSGDTKPSFYSDPEPLTISIAQALAERYEGHSESFAPERHAPVAERAVRTLKGIVSSHELQLRENGVVLGDDPGTLEFLFRYAAHVHNRFAVSVGSTMSAAQAKKK